MSDQLNRIVEIEEKIEDYQEEIARLRNRRNFPYVYIVVAIPTTAAFILLTVISEGKVDLTTSTTGALFFSLLITCTYLVVFQPNRDELIEDLNHKVKYLSREKNKLEAGIKGQRDVAYHLTWLPKRFLVLNGLRLGSLEYEVQEFDHLVIGPSGIFHLETKTINGVIIISAEGDWTLIKAAQNRMLREGMDSPLHQVRRHEAVLQSFLRENFPDWEVPVKSIIVMANPKTIIEGEDPNLLILKRDKLNEYIKEFRSPGVKLSRHQVREIAKAVALASSDED